MVDVGSVDTEVVLKVGPAGDGSDGAIPVVKESEKPVNSGAANRVSTTDTGTNAILVTGLPSTGVAGTSNWWFWLVSIIPLGSSAAIVTHRKLKYSRRH